MNGGHNTNVFLNQAFLKAYGYSLEEVASVDAWRLKAYPDPAYRQWQASTWRAHQEKAEREGVFEPVELNIKCKDGTVRTVLASAASLGDSFERGCLVIHYDVTDRKRFERELRLTQTAIDKSKSAFFRLNPEGVVTYVNDYACQDLGYSREELVGLHVWDFDPNISPQKLS